MKQINRRVISDQIQDIRDNRIEVLIPDGEIVNLDTTGDFLTIWILQESSKTKKRTFVLGFDSTPINVNKGEELCFCKSIVHDGTGRHLFEILEDDQISNGGFYTESLI